MNRLYEISIRLNSPVSFQLSVIDREHDGIYELRQLHLELHIQSASQITC